MKSIRDIAGAITPRQWVVVIGTWIVIAFLLSTQNLVYLGPACRPSTWYGWLWRCLPEMVYAALWILAFPVVMWVSHKYPLEDFRWRNVAAHLVFGTIMVFTTLLCRVTLGIILFVDKGSLTLILKNVCYLSDSGTLSYLFSLVLCFTITYYRNYQERNLAASQLETQLIQAQLQALKSQLHPHFLFNALNTIAMLIRTKEDESAIDMVAGLSDYLRTTLRSYDSQLVPLRQEVDLLTLYLDIQRIRFRDRLQVELDVAPELWEALVPGLILQPLVENAVQHGIAKSSTAGRLIIKANREDGMLAVRISDDGPGLKPDWQAGVGDGIGLKNTRARLDKLYPSGYRLELSNNQSAGATLFLAIPLVDAGKSQHLQGRP